ncbi:MAG TPA: dienelactone hydrolase family protein [Caulobacteraceae bacterium]|nr:dienelactone hydrolase family protein [Caulobacteraceae bacterium]
MNSSDQAQPTRRSALALTLVGAASSLVAQQALAQNAAPAAPGAPPRDPLAGIVAAQVALGPDDWRVTKLNASPRRHEMVHIHNGAKRLAGFVVYPNANIQKAPALVMVAEDQGLNNWAKDMADEIAAMGYIVVVADMLSGLGPNGGDRDSFTDLHSVFAAHSKLPANEPPMTSDLNAWCDYAKSLPQFNGKLGAIGFAWGGGRIFWLATQRKDLSAVYVFYDAAPPAAALAGITAPVYGFYAEHDARVTRSLEATKAAMAQLGKPYEQYQYPGSDHMFVRLGEEPRDPNPANIIARHQSLAKLQELLAKM